MKKVLILLAVTILANSVYASTYTPTIQNIEDVLYGFKYDGESDISRLERIENTVYGHQNKGNITQRMQKLKNDLSADLMGKEITPSEDTFNEEEEIADSNIQYPAVDELEKMVFNTAYPKKDIRERLSALEEKTFGQKFEDDLSTRVDRLKAEIKPNSFMNNAIAQSSNDFYNGAIPELDRNYHLDEYMPEEFDYEAYNARHNPPKRTLKKANISTVEKSLFKHSFQNDSMENRLSRVESAMFGTEFSSEDTQTRLNRISSAFKAQKSASKYDSNKFSQNMATAVQIGTMILMILACIL